MGRRQHRCALSIASRVHAACSRLPTAALRDSNPFYVRFGSEADIAPLLDNVRFTLEADKAQTSLHFQLVPARLAAADWPARSRLGRDNRRKYRSPDEQ
jgi:hypothetical protein